MYDTEEYVSFNIKFYRLMWNLALKELRNKIIVSRIYICISLKNLTNSSKYSSHNFAEYTQQKSISAFDRFLTLLPIAF